MLLLKGKLLTPIQLIFNCTGWNSCDWCTQGPGGRPGQLPGTVGTHTGNRGCWQLGCSVPAGTVPQGVEDLGHCG